MCEHGGETGGFDWNGAEDLTSLSEKLKERLAAPWWRRSGR
jgi:hypothetical protein